MGTRVKGRPRTMTARFFFGTHTKQLWVSKGVLVALNDPKYVQVRVGKEACLEIFKLTCRVADEILAVTQGGYMSGERLWTQLNEKFEDACPYFKAVDCNDHIQLVPERKRT